MPGFRADVAAMRHERKLSLRVAGIWNGLHVDLFDKHFGRDEELHRAEDTAVVGEVAGTSSRKHVKVEGIVHANDKRIRRSGVDEMRNVESKGGVAFARVFAGELPIHPHRGGVKDGGELNSNGGAGPSFGNIKIALVPGHAAILGERRVNLPSVRNGHGEPISCGQAYCEPIVAEARIFRIGAKEPFAIEAGRLGGAGSGKFLCRKRFCGPSGNACSESRGADEEFAARSQMALPCAFLRTARQCTRLCRNFSNQT